MRMLVVSDTHRDQWALQKAILSQPKADVVVHLGDGQPEAEEEKEHFRESSFTLYGETATGAANCRRTYCWNLAGKKSF